MRRTTVICAFVAASLAVPGFSGVGVVAPALAVKAPSVQTRDKAQVTFEKEQKGRTKEECATGCPYGKNDVTGKCLEPKEGELYIDCKTGKTKMKEMTCVNLPWKPCGGKSSSTEKKKAETKKKSEAKDKKDTKGK